ncbi:MAG: GspH/FimT family protein [Pirellulales bacterium]|nr:GspH/FimT family protein [Pirellulales bacterium]
MAATMRACTYQKQRRGVTLVELLAVVVLLGIFGSLAMMRYGRAILGDFGAGADATKLANGLNYAKRTAIMSGNPHALQFIPSADGSVAVGGFQLVQLDDSLRQIAVVDGPFYFAPEVAVTSVLTQITFNFEGQSLQAASVTLAGPDISYQVTVQPINGGISTRKL